MPRAASARKPSHPGSTHKTSLYLLGPFRLERDGKPINLARRKVEALLAYLALQPQPHPRELLAALFWGDSGDEQARGSLRTGIAVLRKQLGENLLLADRDTLQLNPGFPLWIDAREFQIADFGLPIEGQTPTQASNIQNLIPKIDLYRGDLLADFYDDWILPQREQFRRMYVDGLLQQTQELRAQSEYDRAIETARRLLAIDQANERAYQHLIFCYVALGNRPAALEAYAECANALQQELAVEPSDETRALCEWVKQTPPESPTLASRITNLPIPLTSFIGRQREIAEIKKTLTEDRRRGTEDGGRRTENQSSVLRPPSARLLTLTGAGGSGKTRLAIQVGTELIEAFHDGVWWADLSALTDPSLIPNAVAKALGLKETAEGPLSETIADFIQAKPLLLVLDNCEHLIGACAQFAGDWLTACPNLRILATSREPLGIAGEAVRQVPTLSTPSPHWLSPSQLWLTYESVRLFVERARAAKSDFALDEQNSAAVAQICRRLDGIPLALELAAARVVVLTPAQIASRLDDRFDLLTQGSRTALPRQQTLRALIDWSYNLLAADEEALFRRLSVFAGGFALEAAQAVAGEAATLHLVVNLLARLVGKSLIVATSEGSATRYHLLETIREYAGEKLREANDREWKHAKDDHLAYFMKLGEGAEKELDGAGIAHWLAQLEREHDNLRAALQWTIESEQPEPGLRLAASLWRFWKVRGHYHEGRRWYDALFKFDARASLPPTRAHALYAAGMLAYHQSDFARARELQESSLAIWRALDAQAGIVRSLAGLGLALRGQGESARAAALLEESLDLARWSDDQVGVASALRFLGLAAVGSGEFERAVSLFEQALSLQRELGDEEALANVLNNLAIALSFLGKFERARTLNEESLAIRRRLDDPHGIALSLHSLSYLARQRGDWKQGKELLSEALRLYTRLGTKENTVECLESVGFFECQLGEPARAVQLYAAAEALRERFKISMPPSNLEENQAEVADLRSRLAAPTFGESWARGRLLSLEQAVSLALTASLY